MADRRTISVHAAASLLHTCSPVAAVTSSKSNKSDSTFRPCSVKNNQSRAFNKLSCFRCGRFSHRVNDSSYPACSVVCKNYTKIGHFANVCRTRTIRLLCTEDKASTASVAVAPTSSGDNVYDVFCTSACGSGKSEVSRFVSINGHSVVAICDVGADILVLPKDAVPDLVLQPTLTVLKAWGNIKLPVIGAVECKMLF